MVILGQNLSQKKKHKNAQFHMNIKRGRQDPETGSSLDLVLSKFSLGFGLVQRWSQSYPPALSVYVICSPETGTKPRLKPGLKLDLRPDPRLNEVFMSSHYSQLFD